MTVKELKAILEKINENKKVFIGKVKNKKEYYNGPLHTISETEKDIIPFSAFNKL